MASNGSHQYSGWIFYVLITPNCLGIEDSSHCECGGDCKIQRMQGYAGAWSDCRGNDRNNDAFGGL